MIDRKQIRFLMEDDDKVIAELLYHSFKCMNEKKFRKTEPRINQKDANKMISQRYQNVSMKRGINKSALYCGKVKF